MEPQTADKEYRNRLSQIEALLSLIYSKTGDLEEKQNVDWAEVGDLGTLRDDLLRAAGRALGRPDITLQDALMTVKH